MMLLCGFSILAVLDDRLLRAILSSRLVLCHRRCRHRRYQFLPSLLTQLSSHSIRDQASCTDVPMSLVVT